MSKMFKTVPDFYAACGLSGLTKVSLGHLYTLCGNSVEELNRILSTPTELAEMRFPTGGRIGSRSEEISASFIIRKPLLDQYINWVRAPDAVEASEDTLALKIDLSGKSCCMSGGGPRPREVLKAELVANGAVWNDSVSRTTQVLIVSDKTSTASKLEKARKNGTTIMQYDEVFY